MKTQHELILWMLTTALNAFTVALLAKQLGQQFLFILALIGVFAAIVAVLCELHTLRRSR